MATDEGGWPVPEGNLGGASGTLFNGAGSNHVQESLDTLSQSVNRLTEKLGSLDLSKVGGGSLPTAQQGSTSQGFSKPYNPFGLQNVPPGIGGGGPGGAGNVRPPMTFGMLAATSGGGMGPLPSGGTGGLVYSAFANMGSSMMRNQLAMNAYASMSRLGMNVGNGYQSAQSMSFRQAFGVNNTNLNALATSPLDAIAGSQQLQYLGGSPSIMSTSLGRAGFGATAAFGISNPMLSMQQSSGLAQQLYSPTLSQRMMAMGFPVTPRGLGGGPPASSAMIAQSLIQGLYGGRKSVSSAALDKGLGMGGRANASIQALGLNPTQMTPFIQTYNQLFQRGLNTNQAQSLINQASQGTVGGMKAAQQKLSDLGVSTTDIQKIKNNQAIGTARQGDLANGFNAGLTAATGTLQAFNTALTNMMSTMGLATPGGATAGFASSMGGGLAGHLASSLGGGLVQGAIIKRMLTGGATSAATSAAAGAGEAGILSKLLPFMFSLPTAAAAATVYGSTKLKIPGMNKTIWQMGNVTPGQQGNLFGQKANTPGANPLNSWGQLFSDIGGFFRGNIQPSRSGGAGATVPQTSQKQNNKKNVNGGASSTAMRAVSIAEQFVGTPYSWGGDSPQTGFDCSGLVEYAYSQAGIRLPRTSESQWQFLSNRAIAKNSVQAGDILFAAGSQGTPNNPGHEAMMINNRQIIESPHTGADVRIRGYNPGEWAHAARVKGGLGGGMTQPIGGGPGNSITGNLGDSGSSIGGVQSGVDFSEAGAASNLGELAAIGGAGGMMGGAASQLSSTASPLGGGNRQNRGRTGHGPLGGITGGGGIQANRTLMKKLAAAYGWGSGSQWSALDWLAIVESGYNNQVWEGGNVGGNPGAGSSGAYGIAQALPANKYPMAGRPANMGGNSDPRTQEIWMLNYIAGRYKTPADAKAFHLAHNWYSGGGDPKAGSWGIVGDRGPELVNFGKDAKVKSNADTMHLLKGQHALPAQSPWRIPGERDVVHDKFSSRGMNIHLNFGTDAIVVHVDGGGEFDASKSGRMIAEQIVRHISSEDVLKSIGTGRKL